VLAVAHRRGVVHRDLTARNVMVSPAGIKIIDFGLATAALSSGDTGEQPAVSRSVGLPSHPKTAFARPADDVYTLGVLLYEMLTGRSPYPPAIAAVIVAAGRVGHLAPTPVLAIPGLPPELRDLVRACMAKRPEDRPRSVQVALDLWRILDEARRTEPSVN
jgi:serine/threonine-protein kinase